MSLDKLVQRVAGREALSEFRRQRLLAKLQVSAFRVGMQNDRADGAPCIRWNGQQCLLWTARFRFGRRIIWP